MTAPTPADLVVAEAQRIVAAESAKTAWSSEHSNPLDDIIAFWARVKRGDLPWQV